MTVDLTGPVIFKPSDFQERRDICCFDKAAMVRRALEWQSYYKLMDLPTPRPAHKTTFLPQPHAQQKGRRKTQPAGHVGEECAGDVQLQPRLDEV